MTTPKSTFIKSFTLIHMVALATAQNSTFPEKDISDSKGEGINYVDLSFGVATAVFGVTTIFVYCKGTIDHLRSIYSNTGDYQGVQPLFQLDLRDEKNVHENADCCTPIRKNKCCRSWRESWGKNMSQWPQYKYLSRKINRFFGGAQQPFSSTLGSFLVTDYIMHQFWFKPFFILGDVLSRKSINWGSRLLPNPIIQSVFVILCGVPVALNRCSELNVQTNLRRLINILVTRDRRLQLDLLRELNRIIKSNSSREVTASILQIQKLLNKNKDKLLLILNSDFIEQDLWQAPEESILFIKDSVELLKDYFRSGNPLLCNDLESLLRENLLVPDEEKACYDETSPLIEACRNWNYYETVPLMIKDGVKVGIILTLVVFSGISGGCLYKLLK